MKKQWRGFICGFMLAVLIVGMGTTALAATVRQLNAEYSGIKIMLDGEEFIPRDVNGTVVEPFIVDGTTYLPVRAVASAFGLDVAWDGTTQTVILTTPGKQTAATGYGRTNPAPINTPQSINISDYIYGDYGVTVEVENIIRGDEALQKIIDANMFNDAPGDGNEYVLVYIKATVNSNSKDTAISLSKYNFKAYDSSNSEYDMASVVEPEPMFGGTAYVGGSVEGWVAFEVAKSDSAPKIVYGRQYDGSGGIWFSIAG